MAETDNPDDIILNPNRKQKHNTATSTFHEKEDVFEKKDPVTKFFDWWDKLKFKPFVDISTGPEAPDGHSVTVGIKGTF